jgi:hypothetical protein
VLPLDDPLSLPLSDDELVEGSIVVDVGDPVLSDVVVASVLASAGAPSSPHPPSAHASPIAINPLFLITARATSYMPRHAHG